MAAQTVEGDSSGTAGSLLSRRPRLAVGSVTGAACGLFIVASRVEAGRFTLFDDAMVSMSYARTLAEGHGLTWQPGATPVQGYTNTLWTLLMAALHRVGLGAGGVSLAITVISAGLIVGSALLAMALAGRVAPDAPSAPVAAGLLTGLFPPLLFWSLRGMEVGLFTFLALALVVTVSAVREAPSARTVATACGIVAAGLVTRTDFLVPTVVAVAWLVIVGGGTVRRRAALPIALTGAAVAGLTSWWQAAYYGSALPNTYYLKLVGTPLADRVGRGALVFAFQLVAGAAALVALTVCSWFAGGRRRELSLLVATAGAIVGYMVYVGGDAWEWTGLADRYLVPAFVLLIVTGAGGLDPAAAAIRRARRPIVTLAVVAGAAVLVGLAGQSVLLALGAPRAWLQITGADQLRSVLLGLGVAALVVFVCVRIVGARSSRPARRTTAVVLGVALLLALSGPALVNWSNGGTPHTADDGQAARYGEVLRAITTDGATVAVAWAGALPYYSGRTSFDLLGKTDPVIAHSPPHLDVPLRPGHNKWDYHHSIVELAPDVIAQLPVDSGQDGYRLALDEGYVPVRLVDPAQQAAADGTPWSVLLVRQGSPHVRWDLVEPID